MLAWLPKVMANRPAYSLKFWLVSWNLLLALFSMAGAWVTLPIHGLTIFIEGPYTLFCDKTIPDVCFSRPHPDLLIFPDSPVDHAFLP